MSLPVASLTVVGSPIDISLVPLLAPFRPLLNLFNGNGPITKGYQVLGGAPKPLVKWAFQAQRLPEARHQADRARDPRRRPGVPGADRGGRPLHRQHDRLPRPHLRSGSTTASPRATRLATGTFELDDRTIDPADITVPVLVFGGATDGIAPVPAVRAVVPLLQNAEEVRFEVVPGGHLGMLTGRAARTTTWIAMDEWITEWSTDNKPVVPIGTNRKRRTSSAASRSLAK
ncbi:hypothetical protein [Nocardioides convexus]|uniref:hypothetical protein n=1 Tax=Nocardioides convexus TaxID=2712224 RepID=UPI0024183BFC|nr:hypothetical protein [Nocardioides convexus]